MIGIIDIVPLLKWREWRIVCCRSYRPLTIVDPYSYKTSIQFMSVKTGISTLEIYLKRLHLYKITLINTRFTIIQIQISHVSWKKQRRIVMMLKNINVALSKERDIPILTLLMASLSILMVFLDQTYQRTKYH